MSEIVKKKTWEEFRKTGLLLFVNSFLHIFGWAVVLEINKNGKVKNTYPARVKFRGFDEKNTSEAYRKLSDYMDNNSHELKQEAEE